MEQSAGGEAIAHSEQEFDGKLALFRTKRGAGPFGGVGMIERDKGGLTAHGEADIGLVKIVIHLVAEGFDIFPLGFGIGLGDAWGFEDPLHGHFVVEGGVAGIEEAGDGGGAAGIGGAGEGDVTFAGHEPGGGIEPDPTCAGQEDFGPGVEVSEIGCGTGGTVEGFDVSGELDEIAGDEAGGETEIAEDLDEEPGGIPAGTGLEAERLIAGLDAVFEANDIADFALDALVDADEKVDGAEGGAGDEG